jgi:hypothetical protein
MNMKSWFSKSERSGNANISFVLLALLLSSIVIVTFHNHQCHETTDNCAICNFRSSYSAVTVALESNDTFFLEPLAERAVTLNERVTDPSRTRVCSAHAPPYIF